MLATNASFFFFPKSFFIMSLIKVVDVQSVIVDELAKHGVTHEKRKRGEERWIRFGLACTAAYNNHDEQRSQGVKVAESIVAALKAADKTAVFNLETRVFYDHDTGVCRFEVSFFRAE